MKHRTLFCRLTAAALALLMLASCPACVTKTHDPADSDTDTATESVTNPPTDPVDTQEDETQPEDPNEPDAALTPNNAVVVLSPYASLTNPALCTETERLLHVTPRSC